MVFAPILLFCLSCTLMPQLGIFQVGNLDVQMELFSVNDVFEHSEISNLPELGFVPMSSQSQFHCIEHSATPLNKI